jgi:RNA polymerase sigma factor (sigma-70 family)
VSGSMKDVADWDLVARVRDGDERAFEELIARYESPLVHFCLRMTGSREDAEDLAQETFVRVHRYLNRLKPEAKFSTAIFGMARNLTLNYLRDGKRRGRGATASLSGGTGAEIPVTDPAARSDYAARQNEMQEMIERGLAMLSNEHREVIVLREVQGMDYETIAEVLQCRKGTVKSRLARARAHLRQCIIDLGGEIG